MKQFLKHFGNTISDTLFNFADSFNLSKDRTTFDIRFEADDASIIANDWLEVGIDLDCILGNLNSSDTYKWKG